MCGVASDAAPPPPAVGGVIFDLDGTLTRPTLNFDLIRREIGLPTEPRAPVLEALEQMSPGERSRAEGILHRHEQAAAAASQLQDDALVVLAALRRRGVPIGLLTRNSRESVGVMLARHDLCFDCVHTREDGLPKPSPEAVLRMCRQWSVPASAVWVVGYYLFDIQAGRAAGARTVLLVADRTPDYAVQADHVVRRLGELIALLGLTGT